LLIDMIGFGPPGRLMAGFSARRAFLLAGLLRTFPPPKRCCLALAGAFELLDSFLRLLGDSISIST
jgi:hypothetical protein